IIDPVVSLDFAADLTKISSERVCNLLRTAARDRPADNVPSKPEHQTKRGGDRRFQRKKWMLSDSSEKRAGWFVFKQELRQQRCRAKSQNPEVRQYQRVSRQMEHRLQKFVRQIFPMRNERLH